ncbi:MAG: glycine zipper 2TM domain-containing protein [Methylotenera sp.]|uniref:glycine zipper 2TM domain-containing protein n=1 Tax=Methylotenera sp. TaxID=2051956 RepID=UPI0024884201|nr:glycine zipper 2TM domain-containing protein [Methylotenera sp.]MDI1308410.1 glycine zipper 2TM domain-containing protein [Methylotenera sp.]
MSFVKNVRVRMLVPALLTAVFAVPALADQYTDTARVLSSTPQMERVNAPRQECRTEYQQQSYNNGGNNSMTGAIIGGIAGGLLGNTVGRGSGRVAAAAVGAGVGAIAGNSIGSSQQSYGGTRSVPVQTCYQVDNWQSVTTGYLVNYEYNGRAYSTVTNEQPGRYIDVNVAIEPRSRIVSQVTYLQPVAYNRGWDGNNGRRDHSRRGWDKHDNKRGNGRYY